MREVVNAIFYVLRLRRPWHWTSADLVLRSNAHRGAAAWRDACVFEQLNTPR